MIRKNSNRPLIVVAGQVPPPTGGQNVVIERLVSELGCDDRWKTMHLPFHFTPSFRYVRKFGFRKLTALLAVWARFLCLVVQQGRPRVLLYPSGGSQTVPVIRDILLLPLFCLLSHRVVVQFHAAGIAARLTSKSGILENLLRAAYAKVFGAIVMTDFNRRDPEALGISRIDVIPHRIPDENPGEKRPVYPLSPAPQGPLTLLYAGHIYALKGTPQLVEAFGIVAARHPHVRLILMGEFLPPYSEAECRRRCRALNIEDRVEITGVLQGKEKAAQFQAAHLFVFPSIAPYESFGLVMVEAMMWGLPLLITEWRGNRDVAGPNAFYVQPGGKLPEGLGVALAEILSSPHRLDPASAAMRERYRSLYRLEPSHAPYCDYIGDLLQLAPGSAARPASGSS